MEECIEHFSHEHPLSLFQADPDEDIKPYRCRICCLPILSTPSYICSVNNANCNFFVHKPCTQLPEFFYHHLHLQNLYLRKPTLPLNDPFRNFTYKLLDDSSEVNLHPLVAQPVEIKSPHKSHIAHPLVVFCREIVCRCDVCGKEEKGFFFYCKECGFFVHQDCTMLPSVVKLPPHPHPFILTYSLPYSPQITLYSRRHLKCQICNRECRLPDGGVYFCAECYTLAHVDCAKPRLENIGDTEVLHLPDEEDTFPSMVIRRFIERHPSSIKNTKIGNKMISKYHQHPLILEDACSSTSNVVCDVCIQPINNLRFYRCHDCHFLAHPICADHLPDRFAFFSGPDRLGVLLEGEQNESYFNSVFLCDICRRPTNGFSYEITDQVWCYLLDVECTFAPKIVKHASHKQHILFQTNMNIWISTTNCKIGCCPENITSVIYTCCVCDYSIHISCALLPKTTRHKFDDHPLGLIMRHEDNNMLQLQEVFCEVCEKEIKLKWWHYGCRKCEQYFHIKCIPSVGYLSKVKFGKSHDIDYKVHQHPLTLTQMLTHQRHERCGSCNRTIEGFSGDEMAFHCSPCNFWLHFYCAAATSSKKDYADIDDDYFSL